MRRFRSLILTLTVTYGLGVLAARWLALRAFALDRSIVATMALVPVVQAVLLAAWQQSAAAWRRR